MNKTDILDNKSRNGKSLQKTSLIYWKLFILFCATLRHPNNEHFVLSTFISTVNCVNCREVK